MRGISEERLRELKDNDCYTGIEKSVICELISDECEELNQWLPIDGNTPKDRKLLLLTKEYGAEAGQWFGDIENGWWVVACMPVTPTHYQELPGDPDQGDKNA